MLPLPRCVIAAALVPAMGCAAAPLRPVTTRPVAPDQGFSGPADADLPEAEKDLYTASKLTIVDAKDERTYVIKDGLGSVVTENELVRKYRVVVGDELDPYERNHALGERIAWTAVAAAGLGVVVTGLAIAFSDNGQCANNSSVPMTTTGAPDCGLGSAGIAGAVTAGAGFLALAGAGVGLALAFRRSDYDGPPANHLLRQTDAQTYIDRYNRALVTKIVRESQQTSRSDDGVAPHTAGTTRLTVTPVLSPGFAGIVGQF